MLHYESYKESSRYTLGDCKSLSCVQINAMLTYFKSSRVFANAGLSVKKVNRLREDEHMSSMKIVKFFGPPTSLVHLRPKFSHLLDVERPI